MLDGGRTLRMTNENIALGMAASLALMRALMRYFTACVSIANTGWCLGRWLESIDPTPYSVELV